MAEGDRSKCVIPIEDLAVFEEEKQTIARCEQEGIIPTGQFHRVAKVTDYLVRQIMEERRLVPSELTGLSINADPIEDVSEKELPPPINDRLRAISQTKTEDGGPVEPTSEAEPPESAIVPDNLPPTYITCPEDDQEAEEVGDEEDVMDAEEAGNSDTEYVEISDYEEEEEGINKTVLIEHINSMKNAIQEQADAKRAVMAAMETEALAKEKLVKSLSSFAVAVQVSPTTYTATHLLRRLTDVLVEDPTQSSIATIVKTEIKQEDKASIPIPVLPQEPIPSTSTAAEPTDPAFVIAPVDESNITYQERLEEAWTELFRLKTINPYHPVAPLADQYGVKFTTLNSRWVRWLDRNKGGAEALDTRKKRHRKAPSVDDTPSPEEPEEKKSKS